MKNNQQTLIKKKPFVFNEIKLTNKAERSKRVVIMLSLHIVLCDEKRTHSH